MDDDRCVEWCPICRSAEVLRASTSPELRAQWGKIQRNGLIVLRELLDAYIRQLETAQPREPVQPHEPEPAPPWDELEREFEPIEDELAAIYRRFSHAPVE